MGEVVRVRAVGMGWKTWNVLVVVALVVVTGGLLGRRVRMLCEERELVCCADPTAARSRAELLVADVRQRIAALRSMVAVALAQRSWIGIRELAETHCLVEHLGSGSWMVVMAVGRRSMGPVERIDQSLVVRRPVGKA